MVIRSKRHFIQEDKRCDAIIIKIILKIQSTDPTKFSKINLSLSCPTHTQTPYHPKSIVIETRCKT